MEKGKHYISSEKMHDLLGIKDSYEAPEKLMGIIYNKNQRESLFKELLKEHNYDVSYDWFHKYFQDDHSDRKKKKQDFTPNGVSDVLSKIAGSSPGTNLDIAAGTGGITIRKWNNDRLKTNPITYRPSDYLYHLEELSDRALPFLLLNLLIRGLNATVLHGDSLSRNKVRGVFFIQNDIDDHLQFSSLNLMPYTDNVRKEFGILSWGSEGRRHKPIKDTGEFPSYLIKRMESEKDSDERLQEMLDAILIN